MNSAVWHCLAHEARQKVVGVDDRQLARPLRGIDVHAFGFQSRPKGVPVGRCRHQDDPF
jgi:hypothetical protein